MPPVQLIHPRRLIDVPQRHNGSYLYPGWKIGSPCLPPFAMSCADLADAMQAMSSHGVRRLAVTNAGEDIVGVLSRDDVIEALGRDLVLLASIIRCEQSHERTGCVQAPLHV